jgi:ribonuclease G
MADILIGEYGGIPVVSAYEGNRLEYLSLVHESDLGSIYLCRVDNIVKNLDSAFVKYGEDKIGYVPLKHVLPSTVTSRDFLEGDKIRQGDAILLQVETDSIKSKKARLTSYLSISGRYCVVTLGRKGVGASLKLSPEKRNLLIDTVKTEYETLKARFAGGALERDGFGIIVRTEAASLAEDELKESLLEDITSVADRLSDILKQAASRTVYSCISRGDAADMDAHITKAGNFLKTRGIEEYGILESSYVYSLNRDIEKLLLNKVWLKSGGYLIIEQLESFNAIDVNTGKAIDSKKDSAFAVNMEAADEIFRQVRLRNLSGMILIDFINMKSSEDTDRLCDHVRRLCRKEPVHTEFIDITGLGIVELTRNKNEKSLKEILNC